MQGRRARHQRRARAAVVDEDLKAALDSGKVAGAALDVFRSEPITDHPLFGYPNVVVTPHLGASTAEAQDRAGVPDRRAGRRRAHRRRRHDRGQHPGRRAEDMEVLGPFLPLCARSAGSRSRSPRARRRARRGRVPRPDRRARHAPAHARGAQRRARRPHRGGGQPRQRARARRGARDRGLRDARARTRATSPTSCASRRQRRRARARGRHDARPPHRPHLLEAWGQRFNLQLDDPHLALFRYSRRARHGRPRRHRVRRARRQHLSAAVGPGRARRTGARGS
jgi:D-3-phosphoglycerate dehydrogenase